MTALPPDVTDLNALVPARKKVALGSNVYEVPGDMPMEVYLRAQASFASEDEIESTTLLKQAIQELLLWYVPLGEESVIIRQALDADLRPLGVRTIMALLNGIYRDSDADEAAGADAAGKSLSEDSTTEGETPTTTGISQPESSPTLTSPVEEITIPLASAG